MRRLFYVIFGVIITGALTLALAVGPLFLQEHPALEAGPPPSPGDVVATRQLVRDLREATSAPPNSAPMLQTDVAQLNSALRLGARFINGFRGTVGLDGRSIHGRASIPVPWWGEQTWLNIFWVVPEFDEAVTLTKVTAGATDLPPEWVLFGARNAANIVVGNGFGDKVIQAASDMQITGETISFNITLDNIGQNGIVQDLFGSIRGQTFPNAEEIDGYHQSIQAAMEDGRLPVSGSFLPFIRFALSEALQDATAETLPNTYTAAIFGLAQACGAADFGIIVGRLAINLTEPTHAWQTNCDAVTFNGRIDSRRHFITSAALQAASNTGVSLSIGEFKELYDIVSGAGGYDFTDMVANLSGIQMSDYLMKTPIENWPNRLARLETERDVIASFEGIPSLMPEADFIARYDNVESTAYKAMLTSIKDRVSGLTLYHPK